MGGGPAVVGAGSEAWSAVAGAESGLATLAGAGAKAAAGGAVWACRKAGRNTAARKERAIREIMICLALIIRQKLGRVIPAKICTGCSYNSLVTLTIFD